MKRLDRALVILLAAAIGSADAAVARSASDFDFRLYRNVLHEGENAFLSPFSVASVLAMASAGARGETARQMSLVLGGSANTLATRIGPMTRRLARDGKPYELAIANALWVDAAFPPRPAFASAALRGFGAGAFDVDFRGTPEPARARINAWVGRRTRGHIPDLLPPGTVAVDTKLVLTNAVYFKGRWLHPFDPGATRPLPFTRLNGSNDDVPMMTSPKLDVRFVHADSVRVIELDYRGGEISMLVLLPDRSDGLPALEQRLDPDTFDRWTSGLKPMLMDVWLPKFRLETGYSLAPALARLGMPAAFDCERADFSGISARAGGGRLAVSSVIHRAFVDVDEAGTRAAAATGGVMTVTAIMLRPEFHADHPFLFLIWERASGEVLFLGRVVDPTLPAPAPGSAPK